MSLRNLNKAWLKRIVMKRIAFWRKALKRTALKHADLKRAFMRRTTVAMICALALISYTTGSVFAAFNSSDSKVLGVGRIQSTSTAAITADQKLALSSAELNKGSVSATTLTQPISRDIPDEKTEPAPSTKKKKTFAPTDWQTGLASAYGPSNAGLYTASGDILTNDTVAVAVPESQYYLLGATVEVKYNGIVVRAIINDTGRFDTMNRVLDLQPGVWKAFGFSSETQWGVRTVSWRIVG